jgi:hypothetical protein
MRAEGATVLIGLLLIAADLALIAGLVVAVIMAAARLRRAELARPGVSAPRRWLALGAAVAGLSLVVAGHVWAFIAANEDGRPSVTQVAGTWRESSTGAVLRLSPAGTFTAARLPPDVDDGPGAEVTVRALPADERGTWHMARGNGSWYVVCSLTGGPQFRLVIVLGSRRDDPPGALFTYIQGQFSSPVLYVFDKQRGR